MSPLFSRVFRSSVGGEEEEEVCKRSYKAGGREAGGGGSEGETRRGRETFAESR